MKLPVPVYGAVPPDAETLILAEPPLQATGVVITELAASTLGCITVIVVVAVFELASVTV